MKPIVIAFIAGALVGAALVWLAATDGADAADSAAATPVVSATGATGELAEEVAKIRVLLATHLPRATAPAGAATRGPAVPIETEPLRDLAVAVRELTAALPAPGMGAGTNLSGAGPGAGKPTDREAVEAMRASIPYKEHVIVPELFGLSTAEIRRRFGAPTSVQVYDNGSVYWVYEQPDNPRGARQRLTVQFVDGYSTQIVSND